MTASARASKTDREPEPVSRWLVTGCIILGTLMGAIDSSIANVALPEMRASLGATVTEIRWVATGYLVAVVVILPLTAWLSAVVGRKRQSWHFSTRFSSLARCSLLHSPLSFCCGRGARLFRGGIDRRCRSSAHWNTAAARVLDTHPRLA